LHDSAGQTLTVLGMQLAALEANVRNNAPGAINTAQEARSLVDQLAREIRTMSYLLHPPLLDESGLLAALSWFVRGLADRSGIEIGLHVSEEFGRLSPELELAIFRLVQECLTNVHRHSGSKSAAIAIDRENDTIFVEIQDQGKGISPATLAEIQSGGSGVGIRGMRERLQQFQGELAILSSDSGTTIRVTIPVSVRTGQTAHAGI
jgi:two-component system, NarL family, sensor kinase